MSEKAWSVIKETLQRKRKHELPNEFVWNNHVITDMNEVANEFNRYFISIGQSLSEKIQSVHSSEEYLGQKANSVLNLQLLMRTVLIKLLRNLNQNLAQAMTTFQIYSLNMPELF